MNFKAAVLVELNQPIEILELRVADRLLPGQVLVKHLISGICGSQLGEWKGIKGQDKYLPHLFGHESYGVVEDSGPGVSRVMVGDNVICHWMKASGISTSGGRYRSSLGIINSGPVTTLTQYSVVSEDRLTRAPVGASPMIGPLFGCAITTAVGAIENFGGSLLGKKVLVSGVGGIGLVIAEFARKLGCSMLCGLDSSIDKFDTSKKYLFDRVGSSFKEMDLGGFDVVFETTGAKVVIEESYSRLSGEGKLILIGVPRESISISTLPLHFGNSIVGTSGGGCSPEIDIPRYFEAARCLDIDLSTFVDTTFSLADINAAFGSLDSGDVVGRSLVDLWG